MPILQSGKAKSGNFWLYTIIKEAMLEHGVPHTSYINQQPIYEKARSWNLSVEEQADIDVLQIEPEGCYYAISNRFQQKITNMDEYISIASHVWTHSMWIKEQADVFKKFNRIVYIVRDPRDVAISMARFAFKPYALQRHTHNELDPTSYLSNRLYGSMLSWVRHVGDYLLHSQTHNIHFVFYERLLHDYDNEAHRLFDYLGLNLSTIQFNAVKQRVTHLEMQKINPNHVLKGQSCQWVEILSPSQNQRVLRIAGQLLEMLNYPLIPSEEVTHKLPKLHKSLDATRIRKAVAYSRGGVFDKLAYGLAFLHSRRSIKQKLYKGLAFLLNKPVQ